MSIQGNEYGRPFSKTAGSDAVIYKNKQLDKDFIIDQLIEDKIVLELKSVEIILPVHEAQLVTYLKLSEKKLGLLINFNVSKLTEGIRRKINGDVNR